MDHQKWAKIVLKTLVERIQNFDFGDKFITYGNLAKQIGYPGPHTGSNFGKKIGMTLGVMGHLFDGILIDGERVPYIQALVVNQNKKLPSDGLKEFYNNYPNLSDKKKRDYVYSEFEKIFKFGNRWEKLLVNLKIDPIEGNSSQSTLTKPNRYNPYGSEGSPEHIALREYIANNPHAINIDYNGSGIVEYPLKSGDKIDVVFELPSSFIGVEVKSRRSGNDDLERGLYQCIKYTSVLEAENKVNKNNATASCVLVIEGRLTPELRKAQRTLNVKVFEEIQINK